MDVLAVREAVAAGRRARPPGRRTLPHRVPDLPLVRPLPLRPASLPHQGGRSEWKARDPIPTFAARLVESGHLPPQDEIDALEERVEDDIEEATQFALDSPMPPVEELEDFVYAPFKWTEADYRPRARAARACAVLADRAPARSCTGRPSRKPLREEMQRDPSVFLMGEDVGLYGGAYGATRGLFDEFGAERVRDTPISEATIGGAAVGAAMAGMRPVAEIMYVDFTPLAMDQIANQGAKNRYMFGGKTTCPW